MISLVSVAPGSCAVVASLPRARGVAKRLIALGLTPGAEVRVLQNWGRGALIIEVHGVRLALGRGQAARVAVEPLAAANLEHATSASGPEEPGEEE